MSQPPNRTPFDDDLVQDPNAPRHTQPLPAQSSTRMPSGPSSVNSAPVLPPQVVIEDEDDAPQTSVLKPKVPLSAIIGLAAIAGALAVIFISSAFNKMLPREKTPNVSNTTTRDTVAIIASPTPRLSRTPRIVVVPTTPDETDVVTAPDLPTPDVSVPDVSVPDNLPDENDARNDVSITPTPAIEYSNDTSSARHDTKLGYTIEAPRGFRVVKRGRRTIWRGADDAQLLVEIGDAASSPRRGWERLERSLQKKYGAKYQSRGIRETQINGRDAAIWEFELELKSGRVRKMDVAIHDGKRGFAVLGSAPVDKFESYRAQFESAVNSLQIVNNNVAPTPNGY